MADLPFNENIIRSLAEFRMQQGDWYTYLFNLITSLGSETSYILMISCIYWALSKKKATRIAYAILISALVNSFLKNLIQNPRPFVTSGENTKLWGAQAEGYSTPSGHSQIGATFWSTLALLFKKPWIWVISIVMIVLIGASRPILGVHYVEDVLIGWTVGLVLAFIIYWIWENNPIPIPQSDMTFIGSTVVVTLALTLITGYIVSFGVDYTDFITLYGIFAGIAIGERIERKINFQDKASSVLNGVLRIILGIVLIALPLFGLSVVFDLLATDPTLLGYLLRWIRYLTVGVFAMSLAPYLFVKLGLSDQLE